MSTQTPKEKKNKKEKVEYKRDFLKVSYLNMEDCKIISTGVVYSFAPPVYIGKIDNKNEIYNNDEIMGWFTNQHYKALQDK